jgi:hypothetical protein
MNGTVLPHLHLQFCGDPTLLGKITGIEPGAAQFLDARAVGPAVKKRPCRRPAAPD